VKSAAEASVAEASVAEASVAAAEATVAAAEAMATTVSTPLGWGNLHWADNCRGGRYRCGISRGSSTQEHCARHRACADCAGGDAAG
jgi:hypothetical protein